MSAPAIEPYTNFDYIPKATYSLRPNQNLKLKL